MPLERPGVGAIEVATPQVDDALAFHEHRDRCADVLAGFQVMRERCPHGGELVTASPLDLNLGRQYDYRPGHSNLLIAGRARPSNALFGARSRLRSVSLNQK